MTGLTIARYVINYCTLIDKPVSELQLQKILYYIQLNYIRHLGYRAFEDEIQAWEYGPVILRVYEEYRGYGATPICLLYENIEDVFTKTERALTNRIIEKCINLNPWKLVRKSHNKSGPWKKVYRQGQKNIIPVELIENYAKQTENNKVER